VPLAAVWALIVRPRVAVVGADIAVVQWYRTVCFPSRLLVGVHPDYWGSDLVLSDGRIVRTSTLQRPNWAAWIGRASRADKVGYKLLCIAASARGEPDPQRPGYRRSSGDLSGGFFAAVTAAIGRMFG